MDLKDIVNGMLAEVKKEKARPKPPKKKVAAGASGASVPLVDPWKPSAVVLLTLHTTCSSCGEVSVSWEPHLYLETWNRSRPPVRKIERITSYSGKWSQIYATLPKRIEPRIQTSESCPWCFGIEYDSVNGASCHTTHPDQLTLNFGDTDGKLPH